MSYPNYKLPFQRPRKICLLLVLMMIISHSAHSQSISEFNDKRPVKRLAMANSSPHVVLDLDYTEAFETTIKSFNGVQGDTGFCSTYPSQINGAIEYTGLIPGLLDESYDNIAFFAGYYFILDSKSLSILATDDIPNEDAYIKIDSSFQNTVDANKQFEEPNMVIDTTYAMIYIVFSKTIYSYSIRDMNTAIEESKPAPNITKKVSGYKGYESATGARYYQGYLYIIADNYVEVYQTDENGGLTAQKKLDAAFFGVPEISVVDLAFKDNYVFVLDSLDGVFVVNIIPNASNNTQPAQFESLADLRISGISKGQFVDVIGDSLSVVSGPTSKNPFIVEYILRGSPSLTGFVFNRRSTLDQAARDTYADGKFLYIITGFFNIVSKHSIPARFQSPSVSNYLTNYWPLYATKAIITTLVDSVSVAVVLQESFLTLYTFTQDSPIISCDLENVQEGLYSYAIHVVQADCPVKEKNKLSDFNTVCTFDETIEVLITAAGSQIGNTIQSEVIVKYLMIGLGVAGFVFVIFLCICNRYKKQYHLLEEKIKFHKIENDNTDQNLGSKGVRSGTQAEINPKNINIQLELEKAEAQEKEKNNNPFAAPNVGAKPNTDFGDLKPLDIDEIYGKSSKRHEDSF